MADFLRRQEHSGDQASALGPSPSTITRELRRNRRTPDAYLASVAYDYNNLPPTDSKVHGELSISHETIYRYLLLDKKKGG